MNGGLSPALRTHDLGVVDSRSPVCQPGNAYWLLTDMIDTHATLKIVMMMGILIAVALMVLFSRAAKDAKRNRGRRAIKTRNCGRKCRGTCRWKRCQ